jgi:ABC-type multidrug transport system fused ATPase/permease subunit
LCLDKKSTLSLAFFRIISLSGGSIIIDGVDIAEIGLADLRTKLTIISQDPILFSGDLRSNLDPLNENDDSKLWDAIKSVHLLESFQKNETFIQDNSTLTENGVKSQEVDQNETSLVYKIDEKGENLSQGQRQLICLARSLVQTNKIIILDEATAFVDNDTDSKIQNTFRC